MNALSDTKTKKQHQKERLFLREVSFLFRQASADDIELQNLSIHRIELSADRSLCYVYFYASGGKEEFEAKLPKLMLYKPSMRKALADRIQLRYVPDLRFRFDAQYEKQQKIESLLDKIKEDNIS